MITPWDHQARGVEGVLDAIARDYRRIVLSSPTGMGKTWMVAKLVRKYISVGKRVLLYTNRRLMLDQLQRDMDEHGVSFGVRAAGHHPENHHSFQIAMSATDKARSKRDDYEDFPADLVIYDEGHLHVTGRGDRASAQRHYDRGAILLYVTATPIGMGSACDTLVIAGTVSEGRRCGALVPARHFGPDEPAIAKLKHRTLTGLLEMSDEDNVKAIMTPGIFGRVLTWFDKLNKHRKPTLLFAPGVKESRWFAEQFFKHGITAASVDGDEVWINGEWAKTTTEKEMSEARKEVRDSSERGDVTVVCNRFVLREGANWPWLAHGIFATVFDSVQSYIQAGGRLLRSHPSLKTVCIQDHGGNWWRHGSLNEDRMWQLDLDARAIAGAREDAYRDPDSPPLNREPMLCPQCGMVLIKPPCTGCGFAFPEKDRMRMVVQSDGTLVRVTKKMFGPRQCRMAPDTEAKWKQVYWRMRNARRPKSFNQAVAYFFYLNHYRPPRNLPLMPTDHYDWYRPIAKVGYNRLVPDPNHGARTRTKKVTKQTPGLFDVP